MHPLLAADADEIVPILAVAGGLTVGIVWIVFATFENMYKTRQREQSRREIAAYIAEGSMTPQDGERLLNAGKKPKDA